MRFIYHNARLPDDQRLGLHINFAAKILYDKLKYLNIHSFEISDYSKRYLANHLLHLRGMIAKYSYILNWSTAFSKTSFDDFVFLDYGGGVGLLSLLAKQAKIGTVIFNDIYDVSCHDAEILGKATGLQADFYVPGDIDDVICFLNSNLISCNALASNDVIEHIYDVADFLMKIQLLSNDDLNVVLATDANKYNVFVRRRLKKKQLEAEYKNRRKHWGHKDRDCLKAYMDVRKEMICEYTSDLSGDEIFRLVKATRGMMKCDIINCVDKYRKRGEFPQMPVHPTNTCDPFTGNWMEHLMDMDELKDILAKTGFKTYILNGYYGYPNSTVKKFLAFFLNIAITLLKNKGRMISPFLIIFGRKK